MLSGNYKADSEKNVVIIRGDVISSHTLNREQKAS
jgi:hypothetical protein